MSSSYPAGQPGLFVIRCHAQSLDKELNGFVDTVLVVETQASHVECVCVCGIHSQDITVRESFIRITSLLLMADSVLV